MVYNAISHRAPYLVSKPCSRTHSRSLLAIVVSVVTWGNNVSEGNPHPWHLLTISLSHLWAQSIPVTYF